MRTIKNNKGPSGFVRLTLDTNVLEIEAKQVDYTTNLLPLMILLVILLAFTIGIILARTLLQNCRSRWQPLPYLC